MSKVSKYPTVSMKRILSSIIIAAALFTACSKNIPFTPGISFLTPTPEILEETAIFRLIGQPFETADTVRIPVTFGGSAKKGTDYRASADCFIFTKDAPRDSIVISTKKLGTGRTVSLSVEIPEGFTAGKYTTSEFRLQDKYGLLSFSSRRGYAADTTECYIVLHDSTGSVKALTKDCSIGFELNTEKSTAVEGVDFEFDGHTALSIPAQKSSTGFRIIPKTSSPQAGRNKIVLNVTEDEKFGLGLFPELEIDLLRGSLKVLDGSWKMDTLITDSLYFEKIWGNTCTGYSLVPEFGYSDSFDISLKDALFTPSFASKFKLYFQGESILEFSDDMYITDPKGQNKKIQLLSLDNTNRFFSADTTSADAVSFVGFHLDKEDGTEEDILELYVLDHTSMSFMPELVSGMKYAAEKPVAATPGLYLNATFRKSK